MDGAKLRNGTKTSCGCKRKKPRNGRFVDMTGKKIGKWTVLKRAPDHINKNGSRSVKWICQCECGEIRSLFAGCLKSGGSKSCGCIGKSIGEHDIEQYLQENEIAHSREYAFPDLLSSKNYPLRFDFYIYDKNNPDNFFLLEYQGEQHFYEDDNIQFGYQQRVFTDKQKKEYCKEHNYKFYEITYKDETIPKLKQILVKENMLHDNTVLSIAA